LSISRSRFFEAVGILSVVLSLLFVAFEIRQTNQIAMVSTEIEIRNTYSELNEAMFSDPELSKLLERAAESGYGPQPGEYTQLRSLSFRFLNIWLASEVAYENEMLPEASFKAVLNDIGFLLQTIPYLRTTFKDIVENYPGWSDTMIVKEIKVQLERDT
jgi:hypothetical protein